MNDIALWALALLLPLFCLIYSLTARRELYLPLPKDISDKLRNQHTLFLAMLCVLILAAAASMAEAVGGAESLGLIHTAGAVLRIILFCLFALYSRALPKADRKASVLLMGVAAAGVLVRAIWSAPVDLFFASVSVFGCMVLFERDADAAESGMSDRFRLADMAAVALIFLLAVVINVVLILNLTRTQSDEIGRIQLDVIRSELQDTLSSAEANLLHTAIRAEQLIDADAPRDSIEHFILDQRESLLADESFMNIYIAGSDWHFVPDFEAPADFHAAERVWYIGASEHSGEVFISEPYKQEEVNHQLVQAAEMAESANRAKSQFLSQMSHEIRTPMNAILGLDSIALRDPDISPRTRGELEKIGASAKHLLALINDILDMSRIESGRMELNEKAFSLRDFMEQINVIVGGQCEDKGLQYECRMIGTPDERFIGDDLKLKQVLINILGNSVKFTERPGSVFFSVEEIERRDGRCRMRFVITDTGIGMDKAFIDKLFDAFSQEDATATNKYGGSGLGMAITKRMVDMMGGEIRVESEKGVGSTFTVTIPLGLSLTEEISEKSPRKNRPRALRSSGCTC